MRDESIGRPDAPRDLRAVRAQQLHDAGADRAEADQADARRASAGAGVTPAAAPGASLRAMRGTERRAAERPADAAHGLAGAVLVLDQREAHVLVAVLAEADARATPPPSPRCSRNFENSSEPMRA